MRYGGYGSGGAGSSLVLIALILLGLFMISAWIHSKKPKETEATIDFIVRLSVTAFYLAITAAFSLLLAVIPAKLFDLEGSAYIIAGAIIFAGFVAFEFKKKIQQ